MLLSLEIERREPVLDGRPFGEAGAYEQMRGRATFAVDPNSPLNAVMTDIAYAPRDAEGRVRCVADWWLLRPVDPARASGTLLYNVVNRGNQNALAAFNRAMPANRPESATDFGDGFLMRRGTTVAAVGWQADVRPGLGRMLLEAPAARDGEAPITGPVRMTIILDRAARSAALVREDHSHYPPLDVNQPDATLRVRDTPYSPARLIVRDRWALATDSDGERRPSRDHIWLADGFEPGRIYEVVYTAAEPAVMGLGFAVTRDFVSYLRYEQVDGDGAANPLWAGDASLARRAVAYGASQSGRFLRHYVQLGFNEDEQERTVFDGMLVHIAAGGVGSFNHRFAQPSRTRPHANGVYPVELFPFADAPMADPHGSGSAGLLDRARARDVVPRIMYTNTSAEYWGGGASLIHTDPLGTRDVPLPDEVRAYHVAGSQHVPAVFPPGDAGMSPLLPYPVGHHPASPMPVHTVMRALLAAMERWLSDGTPPPASEHPRIADGTLVSHEALRQQFPSIPGVRVPSEIGVPRVLEYGPRWPEGVIEREPPELGAAYGALVPAVDADGNETGGIRLPELTAPLATYTGWNLRHAGTGNPGAVIAMMGSYLPFPATRTAAAISGDPRPSIAERYKDREAFMQQVEEAIAELTRRGLLLEEDAGWVRHRAEQQWAAHAPASAPAPAD